MNRIDEFLRGVRTVAIAGHVNPDGDCIGSCMGIWMYLRDNFPEIQATVYLESFRNVFGFLEGIEKTKDSCGPEDSADLMILTDISSRSRIGAAAELAERTENVLCFDHHITNTGSYTWFFNRPEASSASEVVFTFLDPEKISPACAAALYMGIAHDTGVFQYSSTSPETMRIAAYLMEKGIPFSQIIDESYYQKTYEQNQVIGKVLLESRVLYDGRIVIGKVSRTDMQVFGVEPKDMDGIINELRNTSGVEAAVFLYELEEDLWKVSLRSRSRVDVSRVAQRFGGGGHVRAAGCNLAGTAGEVEKTVIRAFGEIMAQV